MTSTTGGISAALVEAFRLGRIAPTIKAITPVASTPPINTLRFDNPVMYHLQQTFLGMNGKVGKPTCAVSAEFKHRRPGSAPTSGLLFPSWCREQRDQRSIS